ncbi:phosphoglucomutase [Pseudomonas phage vB_PaeM_PA5oct]|uniref:Phosphoglucomutase n=1 Tax=Pseudomonas phage vB_PaeM_PA5oct TaxID=2163605 RepID=A0A4Y5JT22_9CAUD|nr:phosphoglucomutase [Pseudomonas phage vB_PaeM_PA5oct]QCG75907.1 phosphoglucomutase [Pseudomonas phage vB_PaeM_PA5oct]
MIRKNIVLISHNTSKIILEKRTSKVLRVSMFKSIGKYYYHYYTACGNI